MTAVVACLQALADQTPSTIVLSDERRQLTVTGVLREVAAITQRLQTQKITALALYADNSCDWVVLDLACQQAGIILLPIPLFFSSQQTQHALESAGIAHIAVQTGMLPKLSFLAPTPVCDLDNGMALCQISLASDKALLPNNTQKITFTSGSSGTPKGVCLSQQQQMAMVEALLERINRRGLKHLCLLPLSTLLENLAGVYAPLVSGGSVVVPSLSTVGLAGSSGLSVPTLIATIDRIAPDSLILLPQMLQALVVAALSGWPPPASLKFVAVGGAKVAPGLIEAAVQAGIPVFQGYGLSECASVVALTDASSQLGASVGQPLNHVDVVIENGEVVIKGNVFLGYVNAPESWAQPRLYTGDMGHLDDNGLLYLSGRKKNIQISSFGRNINPEWVESELMAGAVIKQAVVFTEAKPYLVALLEPMHTQVSSAQIQQWLNHVNAGLPDYAQVKQWQLLPEALSQTPQLITANGRVKREAFYSHYQTLISTLYKAEQKEMFDAVL